MRGNMIGLTFRRLGCGCFDNTHQDGCDAMRRSRRRFLQVSSGLMAWGIVGSAEAQEQWDPGLENTCSFYPNDVVNAEVFTFGSVQEANEIVSRICSTAGLYSNFEVLQANVPN